ncbi:hypothetical protein AUP68_05678 [Ilyonectria robusta]
MSVPARLAPRLRPLWSSATSTRAFASASKAAVEEWPQRTPLGPYYESILKAPPPRPRPVELPKSTDPTVSPADTSASSPTPASTSQTTSSPAEQTPEERVRNIFGSRVLTPEEMAVRLATKKSQSTYIGGILVPPKPEEPDNCCMSGCVNCVWERFREEMEEWALQNATAQKALAESAGSVDDDGGGSESNWTPSTGPKIAKDLWAKDVFESVPVGIREFMKQEKRLKEMHEREASAGN